jgi:hypothetical protein
VFGGAYSAQAPHIYLIFWLTSVAKAAAGQAWPGLRDPSNDICLTPYLISRSRILRIGPDFSQIDLGPNARVPPYAAKSRRFQGAGKRPIAHYSALANHS